MTQLSQQQIDATVADNQQRGLKDCFGLSWNSSSEICAGKLDPGFLGRNGSRRKGQCALYVACSSQTTANKTQPKPPAAMVPLSNLMRNVQGPPNPAQSHPGVGGVRAAYPTAPSSQAYYQQPQYYQQPSPMQAAMAQMVPPWMAQMGAAQAPMNYQAPGAHMPSYLAVLENPGKKKYFARMLIESGRSAGKSVGHTVSSFFDNNPWDLHDVPEAPKEPEGQG